MEKLHNLLQPETGEAEKKVYEGGAAVDRRLFECGRGRQSMNSIVKLWCKEEPDKDRYYAYCTIWDWMFQKAQEENKNLTDMPCTPGALRLTLEYLKRIHEGVTEIDFKELRKYCNTRLDEFLLWDKSILAAFVFHLESDIETKRIQQQYRLVRQTLVDRIKQGDTKAVDIWVKLTNKDIDDNDGESGIPIQLVNQYITDGKISKTVPVKK